MPRHRLNKLSDVVEADRYIGVPLDALSPLGGDSTIFIECQERTGRLRTISLFVLESGLDSGDFILGINEDNGKRNRLALNQAYKPLYATDRPREDSRRSRFILPGSYLWLWPQGMHDDGRTSVRTSSIVGIYESHPYKDTVDLLGMSAVI